MPEIYYAGMHLASTFYHQTTAQNVLQFWKSKVPGLKTEHTDYMWLCMFVSTRAVLLVGVDTLAVRSSPSSSSSMSAICLLCLLCNFINFILPVPKIAHAPYTHCLTVQQTHTHIFKQYLHMNGTQTYAYNQTTTLWMLMLELQFRYTVHTHTLTLYLIVNKHSQIMFRSCVNNSGVGGNGGNSTSETLWNVRHHCRCMHISVSYENEDESGGNRKAWVSERVRKLVVE